MWLTSNDAVNRFDGKMCKVYNLNKYFLNCPNLQQGYGFQEDDFSNIYIGSIKGLYIYHRNQDKFTLKKIFKNNVDDVAMPIGFRNGKIWCFNRQFQIATYDIKTEKVELISQVNLDPLISVHIYQLNNNVFYHHYPFIDKNNIIWFVGNTNIACYDIKTKKESFPIQNYINQNKSNFYSSYYDPIDHTIFLGTEDGILVYNIKSKNIIKIKNIENELIGRVTNIVANDNMIVIKNSQKIIFISKDLKKLKNAETYNNYNASYSYSFDKSNRLWICDDGKGQVIYNFNQKFLKKLPAYNSNIRFNESNIVSTIAEFPDGKIVVQGNYLFDKKNNNLDVLHYDQLKNIVPRITTDKFRKGIWYFEEYKYNTNSIRIFFCNKNKKLITFFDNLSINDYGLQQDLQVLPSSKIICSFQTGLYWLNAEKKTLEKNNDILIKNPFKINTLTNNRLAISYLNNDMLLVKMDKDNGLKIISKILPGIQSFYVQEDQKRNRYWIGTNEGIFLLDKSFKILKKIDANNGLAGTYIYGLLLDDFGNVFCSHQRGLSSIDSNTFQVINFDKSDGIQDWDFNNRSFYKASDGTLYFGGMNGLNYFKPPIVYQRYYKPEVYVDEILVNNISYSSNKNSNNINSLNLNFSQNNISIKTIVKDLSLSNAHQIIYRIKEIDKNWKFIANNSWILFNNLSPNDYTIQLGIYDKYTNKKICQKTVFISISLPFYLENWFFTILIILLTVIILWIVSKRKLSKQKIIFQQKLALEQQRNKITADLHDDIGATLSSLQINSAVANQLLNNKNASEAQKVLLKIENQSQNLSDKIGDIIWSMKPGKDEFMTLSTRIKNFANEILGSTNINYQINIDKKIDQEILDITTRKNIVLVVKEAINNVAKYSKAKKLIITITIDVNQLFLKISDNGIGFDTNRTLGNGIDNMTKRIEELNGSFSLISNQGIGTTIEVYIPIVPKFNDTNN